MLQIFLNIFLLALPPLQQSYPG